MVGGELRTSEFLEFLKQKGPTTALAETESIDDWKWSPEILSNQIIRDELKAKIPPQYVYFLQILSLDFDKMFSPSHYTA